MRWLLVVVLALGFISWLSPLLNKLGMGKLPGDLRFKLLGRDWYLPITTTLLLSFAASAASHWL